MYEQSYIHELVIQPGTLLKSTSRVSGKVHTSKLSSDGQTLWNYDKLRRRGF